MIAANELDIPARSVRLRPIALPAEHGGWSLLLEPIVLSLLLAPSAGGICLALAAVTAFLLRHPLKIAVGDWRRHRRMARTRVVHTFVFLYTTATALCLLFSLMLNGITPFLPLLIAAPLVLIQLSYDLTGRSRALAAELAGSIATGALATSIAVAGGWPLSNGLVLWAIVVARAAPTVVYLRARLRLLRGKSASITTAIWIQLLAIAAIVTMVSVGVAPVLVFVAMTILFARALVGLSRFGKNVPAKTLGLRELLFGAVTVVLVVLGFLFHY